MFDVAIVGSAALNEHLLLTKHTGDLDIIASIDALDAYFAAADLIAQNPISGGRKMMGKQKDGFIIEAEIAWEGTASETLLRLIIDDKQSIVKQYGDFRLHYASLNLLYTLKMSHRYLRNSPFFLKTMHDIEIMQYFGAKLEDEYADFYAQRCKNTYSYRHPNLNTNKKQFFSDVDLYEYDHDEIHKIIAIDGEPAYIKYAIPGKEVLSSKEMFFSLDERTRLLGGLEETLVLALERSQIPNDFKPAPEASFLKSLEKVCTNITSGWFREFCWENYYKIKSMYDAAYVERFRQAVADGTIQRISNHSA